LSQGDEIREGALDFRSDRRDDGSVITPIWRPGTQLRTVARRD